MKLSYPQLILGKHRPKHPLIQGGMGVRISGGRLAGSVAACGCVGTIASVGLACDSPRFNGKNYFAANRLAIADELAMARKIAPDGILAVNCMVALTDYEEHVKASCEGGANAIISGAGLPLKLPEYVADFPDVAIIPIVSSQKAASIIIRRWEKNFGRLPDAFVVETPNKAGGHLGASKIEDVSSSDLSLEKVVPELVKYLRDDVKVDIPVIAAGGIWDKSDMESVFALGANGVQMGTRFVCTKECDAYDGFKKVFLDAKADDIVIINSPVGIPGRAVKTPFVAQYLQGSVESKPCIANCLHSCSYKIEKRAFCIAAALVDGYMGKTDTGLFFCGSNVTKCDKIVGVKDIIDELFGN